MYLENYALFINSVYGTHVITYCYNLTLGAGVGVLGGLLYSVGGHDGPLVRKSVEVYNPDTKTWTSVSDMNFCRRNAGIVAHNGLLYVIGGDDGTR
jgi:kelch-like protein 2/3